MECSADFFFFFGGGGGGVKLLPLALVVQTRCKLFPLEIKVLLVHVCYYIGHTIKSCADKLRRGTAMGVFFLLFDREESGYY